ncbi:MAG: DNA repair protein RecN [Gammaproteobacteria bacterium HGW-Gammaproteobacteria-1]|jgi:DNA repair protein RecN (Recombination protein N)|nr:MAG: DNA repair protein RecN [Gammaproteobacteria bacterium HGW-Gammaproteobacteria-1]
MLKHLAIRNFALVEHLELEFVPGMTVLTGETGAGKSILLDALGLVLGDRADSGTVRAGCDRAEISATFEVSGLTAVGQWLEERELNLDGECILRRTVSADGGSRGYINGQPAPVQSLRELGEQLVDIHGQHAHQSLLKRDLQRQLLDAYAGHQPLVDQVSAAYRRWHELQQELERLSRAAGERDSRLELLRYQVGELEALGLSADELHTLEEEHGRLANASRLQEGAQRALDLLYEGDELAIVSLLGRTLNELRDLQTIDAALAGACELLEGASIQAREAAGELRHYLDRADLDPERVNWVEQRLAAVQELARKHRCGGDGLPALLEQLQHELAELEQAGQRLDGLEAEIRRCRDDYLKLAAQLSAGRGKAAKTLGEQVSANMAQLGMKGGRFEVALEALDNDEPAPHGMERVELLVTANPGQPLKPLSKVASGGELSRISLAIQVISAGRGSIPTLIFDEVDVGVGGGVAEMVGRQLHTLGGERQVLCVTHQPQVAAQGHQHLQVSKQSKGENTRSAVKTLSTEERVEEIARMLGGMTITEQTLSHAREMLSLSQAQGQERGARGKGRKKGAPA